MPRKGKYQLLRSDALEALRSLPDESVDSIVTDPPYGLSKEPDIAEVLRHWLNGDDYKHKGGGFMGKSWDSFVPGPSIWRECLRVLKPGGHLVCFAGSRTVDLMGISIRLAGFEIRDQIQWIYGSGFPKSSNVSKMIDKAAGITERPIIGEKFGADRLRNQAPQGKREGEGTWGNESGRDPYLRGSVTPEAERWDGWGTALKPAHEPIILARKPFKGTVANNVLTNGTGALNINATRVRFDSGEDQGRWPANVILTHDPDCKQVGTQTERVGGGAKASKTDSTTVDFVEGYERGDGWSGGDVESAVWECVEGCAVAMLDEQSGTLTSGTRKPGHYSTRAEDGDGVYMPWGKQDLPGLKGDSGGASRFFYCAKANKKERNAGLPEGMKNTHPTVKPIKLMEYLVKMVTPPGGTVLDPYTGSGTTGVASRRAGFRFIGIDKDEEGIYLQIAKHRIGGKARIFVKKGRR